MGLYIYRVLEDTLRLYADVFRAAKRVLYLVYRVVSRRKGFGVKVLGLQGFRGLGFRV